MVWFDQDEEKAREYRRMTERAIFAVLKAAYGHRGLRMIKERNLFSENTNELYQDVKADDLGTSKTEQENVLMGISYVFYQKSERIEDALKLCMIMMGPHRYCDSLRLSFRTVYERVNQLKLPISEKVKLAAASCFLSNCPAMEQFDKICVQAAAWLTECYQHDRDVVLELYQEFSKEDMVEAFPLLGILMREESFMNEAEADNKVIGYFETHQGLSFFYKGNQVGDYRLLQKEKLDLNELELRIRNKGRSYQELIAVCAIMFDYSLSARNVFRLLIAREFIWNYQSYFAGMEGFSKREAVKAIKTCEKIREFLDETSLHQLVKDIYVQWLREGADTKVKNLLIPYAISADVSDVTELKKQIDQWTENSRGALAAFAVSALAFNRSDLSLLIIDGITKKSKNKQVRAAAENAMEKAAATLEITKETLGDLIIPNLGFNRNRERIFDYGSRTFKGVLTEKLEVLVYDETGKQLKNLPKPGAKDDQTLAAAEAAAFKDLKKQLKTVVSNQKVRLEEAVITGRRWTRKQWEKLFVDNPVMNGFAIGLIWEEVDESGVILGTFRYMEDGSFNSPDEEEYELRDDSEILLLHPLDVPEELLETWKKEDYEVKQPILQLTMPVYSLIEEELDEKRLARYESTQVHFGTIRGMMDKYSWNAFYCDFVSFMLDGNVWCLYTGSSMGRNRCICCYVYSRNHSSCFIDSLS